MKRNKVVVTGLGVVSSIGENVFEFWRNCLDGKVGTNKIEKEGIEILNATQGGQIKNFKSTYPGLGRSCQLLIAGLDEAIADSNLNLSEIDRILIGTTMGETTIDYTLKNTFFGIENPSTFLRQNQLNNLVGDALKALKIEDVETCLFCNACSGGNYALISGFESIRNGLADVIIVCGVDSFSTIAYYGFSRLNAIASEYCRPFDENRDGMLVAEGVGCLVLESEKHAKAKNQKIYAEISGYGMSSDAFHINVPHPEGSGIELAIKKALDYANLLPEQIDYISAHGTGTIANDKIESKILENIFGNEVPISSIKSMIGHSMGAASSIEAIVCCLSIVHGKVPPTANNLKKDPECNINCVPNIYQDKEIVYAMNNSYAFAGSNASVIFKKYLGESYGDENTK
jgi:3-oxoacyl-[acyl-carrier-protein] synthase II